MRIVLCKSMYHEWGASPAWLLWFQGMALSNKAQGMEGLIMGLHEQVSISMKTKVHCGK